MDHMILQLLGENVVDRAADCGSWEQALLSSA